MKRFYKDVSVGQSETGFSILLDGKHIKTPLKKSLSVPTRALAEAIAEEWRGQGSAIELRKMPLTRLANTAIDRGDQHRDQIVGEILTFGAFDLLCYRATETDLAGRQHAAWDPVLEWLADRHGARLDVTAGMSHIAQPEVALLALEKSVRSRDAHALVALHAATTITGSLVLALALLDARLDWAAAFALSQLDEKHQAEKWGEDKDAVERARTLASELELAARFARLSHS